MLARVLLDCEPAAAQELRNHLRRDCQARTETDGKAATDTNPNLRALAQIAACCIA